MSGINLTEILLIIVAVGQSLIFFKLGSVAYEIRRARESSSAYNDDHWKQRKEHHDIQSETFENISHDLSELKGDVNDMKTVLDIFYKYKLPNKSERVLLDEIDRDSERDIAMERASKNNNKT